MATKKTTTTKVIINGKEFDINKKLPTDFLKQDNNGIPYVEVSMIREIARQMDIIQEVRFSDIKFIAEGRNKKGATIRTALQTCYITLKDGRVFEGFGSIMMTDGMLLSDAAYGTISRLRARAFKDALKYVATIFEFPVDEEETLEKVENKISQKAETNIQTNQTQQRDYAVELAEYLGKLMEDKKIKDEAHLKTLATNWLREQGALKKGVMNQEQKDAVKNVVDEFVNVLNSNKEEGEK